MDLTKQNWSMVLKGNNLLSGFALAEEDTIKRARKPAFALFDEGLQEPGVPEIELFDDSYITVTELHSIFQSSAVNHCLDLKEVSGSLKSDLVILPAGAGGSVTYQNREDRAESQIRRSSQDELYVAYNFPRVIVYLEPEHLQLTPACRNAIKELEKNKDLATLNSFYSLFGLVFPMTTYLGGRLQCTRSGKAVAGSNVSEKTETLKRAASAIFTISRRNNMSASYDRESASNSVSSSSSGAEFMSSAWEARGGDTLLSTDPAAWAPTVKPFENWRAVNRTDIKTMIEVIGSIRDFEHVPELVKSIIQNSLVSSEPETVPDPNPQTQGAGHTSALPILSKAPASSTAQALPGTGIAALRRDFGGCSGEWTFFQDTDGWIRCTVQNYRSIVVAQERIVSAKMGSPIAAMCVQDKENIYGHKTKIRLYYITQQETLGELSWNELPDQWVVGPLSVANIKVHPSSQLCLHNTDHYGHFLWYQQPDLRIGQFWCEHWEKAKSFLLWVRLEPTNVLPAAAAGTPITHQDKWPSSTLETDHFKEKRIVVQSADGKLLSVSVAQPRRSKDTYGRMVDVPIPQWLGKVEEYMPHIHRHLPAGIPAKFLLMDDWTFWVDQRGRLTYLQPRETEPKYSTSRLMANSRLCPRKDENSIHVVYQDPQGDLQQLKSGKSYFSFEFEKTLLHDSVETVSEMMDLC